jgi:hypothetical protein
MGYGTAPMRPLVLSLAAAVLLAPLSQPARGNVILPSPHPRPPVFRPGACCPGTGLLAECLNARTMCVRCRWVVKCGL